MAMTKTTRPSPARLAFAACLVASFATSCGIGADWTLTERDSKLPGILLRVPSWTKTERLGRPLNGATLWMAPERRHTFVSLVWRHAGEALPNDQVRRTLEGDGTTVSPTGVPNGELGAFESIRNVATTVGGHKARLWRLKSLTEPEYAARIHTWHCPKTHRHFQLRVQTPIDERDTLVKASAAMAATVRCHTEDVGHLRFERRSFGGLPKGNRIRKIGATRCVVEAPRIGYFTISWTPTAPTEIATRDRVAQRIRFFASALGDGVTFDVSQRENPLRGHKVWLATITARATDEKAGAVVYALWACPDTRKLYEIIHPSPPKAQPDLKGLEALLENFRCH